MSNTNTGGPAFPAPTTKPLENYYPGMTLRDYFAAKAMQGATTRGWSGKTMDAVAQDCYQMADAMLKARDVSKEYETAIDLTRQSKASQPKSGKKQKPQLSVNVNELSRIVRVSELSARLGLSVSSIYVLVARGTLPKPKPILSGGRAVGWDSEVIEAWLSARDGASKEKT